MTEASIRGEHYAGVQTGGMDQSISIMAPNGSALLIDFYPALSATAIKFPKREPAPVFVIANTLIVADKHTTAPTNYNLRVVETRLAAAVLMKMISGKTPTDLVTLRQIQDFLGSESDLDIQKLTIALELVEKDFKKEPYTLQAIAAILELSPAKVNEIFVGSMVIKADGFKLYARTKHVLSEARRVLQFRDVCLEGTANDADHKDEAALTVLKKLGGLMNESHESCRDLFNCSCPELDQLRAIAL
jgi:galactokinase